MSPKLKLNHMKVFSQTKILTETLEDDKAYLGPLSAKDATVDSLTVGGDRAFAGQLVHHLLLLVGGDSHQVGEEYDQLGEVHFMD